SNNHQIGLATLMYVSDYDDSYPRGVRVVGATPSTANDPTAWNILLLRYLGIASTNSLTAVPVYVCPVRDDAVVQAGVLFPVSYRANMHIFRHTSGANFPVPLRASMIMATSTAVTMFEKNRASMQYQFDHTALDANRMLWNSPTPPMGMTRHESGCTATIADGHAERIKLPPFVTGGPVPADMFDMGDVRGNPTGGNVPNLFVSTRAKVWFRETTTSAGY
ncbi:MAG: hypothetical protein ABMA26_18795, partial [Limisphaerales bacterium]